MVDKDLIGIKLGELGLRLERARSHCPPTVEQLAQDDDALDIVAFNLMLAMQSALDLASHIIADEGWEPASNLAESFRRLGERGILRETPWKRWRAARACAISLQMDTRRST